MLESVKEKNGLIRNMGNEPKKHHYIPQFILKNFINENKKLFYWDLNKKELSSRYTKFVFMNHHMYRDEINHSDQPTFIEKSLSVFENDMAKIFQKLNEEDEVILLRKELETLRIFLCLLSFRSDLRMKQYTQNMFDDTTRNILKEYAINEDYADLWKREIEELSKCRSYQQINDSTVIDPIIKQDLKNALKGYYMTLVDARGGDFIITDVYPTLEIYPISNGCNIHLHCLYPISPTRLLLLNHIMFRPDENQTFDIMKERSQIKGNLIIPPGNKYVKGAYIPNENDEYRYKVRKIYSGDVEYINSLILNEARIGIAFNNAEKILPSVRAFNQRTDTKQVLEEFEQRISSLGGCKYD